MSKSKKIWLGIFTFLPVICMIAYFLAFGFFFYTTIQHAESNTQPDGNLFAGIGIMIMMMAIALISGLVMLIYYIVHALKNPKFDSNKQLLWIIILVLASGIGNLIYYFVEILPSKPEE